MVKKLGYMQWGLLLLGVALGYAGWRFDEPVWISIGVTVAGLGIAAGGIEDMMTRSVSLTYGEYGERSQSYQGLSALLFGILWILVGLGLVLGGLAYALGLGEALGSYLRAHPGPILVLLGLAMIAYGGVETLGAREERPSASLWGFLGSVPARVFSLMLVFVGLVTLTAGLLELVAPHSFDAMLARLGESLLPQLPE